MKLLDKETIRYQRNVEKREEIAQGAQLAKSIDYLRQQESKEKRNLESYREQSLKKIFTDIQENIIILNSVKEEIIKAREERDRLIAPLNKELQEISLERQKLESLREEIATKKTSIAQIEFSLNKREEDLSYKESEIARELVIAKERRQRSEAALRENQAVLSESQERKAKFDLEYAARLRNLERREQRAIEKELECQSIIKTYREKIKEIDRLNKRYATEKHN